MTAETMNLLVEWAGLVWTYAPVSYCVVVALIVTDEPALHGQPAATMPVHPAGADGRALTNHPHLPPGHRHNAGRKETAWNS